MKCVHRFNLILRPTEVSRRLGFLRFHTIDASREFVERNHPYIFFYGPTNDRSTQVRIAYSREREDRPRASDWNCRKVSQRGGPRQPAFPDRRGTQLPTRVLFCAYKISVSFSTFPHVHIVSSAVIHDPVRTPPPPFTQLFLLTLNHPSRHGSFWPRWSSGSQDS